MTPLSALTSDIFPVLCCLLWRRDVVVVMVMDLDVVVLLEVTAAVVAAVYSELLL